jgi:hypothetical protein
LSFVLGQWEAFSAPAPPIGKDSRCNVWGAVEGLQTTVTGDILRFKRLDVSARKVGVDTVIGEGSASLRAVGVEYGKAVTVVVKMKDKRGKPKGRLELILQVNPSAKATRANKAALVSAASSSSYSFDLSPLASPALLPMLLILPSARHLV